MQNLIQLCKLFQVPNESNILTTNPLSPPQRQPKLSSAWTSISNWLLLYHPIRWSNTVVRRPESPNAWQRDPGYALGVGDDNYLIIHGGFISHFTVSLGKKKKNHKAKEGRICVRNIIFATSTCIPCNWCAACSAHSPLRWLLGQIF